MSDFAWIPDYTVASDTEFKTQESEFENGVKQYRGVWSSARRHWKLSFLKRTLTETLAILAFFETKLGKAASFTWTAPDANGVPNAGTEYTVRFGKDKFSYDYVSFRLCDFEIELTKD